MDANRQNYYNTLHALQSEQQFSPSYGNYQYHQSNVQNHSPYSPGISIVRSQTIVRHRFTSSISNHPSAWKSRYTPPGYTYMAYPQQLYNSPHCISYDQQETASQIASIFSSNHFADINMFHQDYSNTNVVVQNTKSLPFISDEFKNCMTISSDDHQNKEQNMSIDSLSQQEVISRDKNGGDSTTKNQDDAPSTCLSIPTFQIKNQFLDSKAVQNSVLLQHALNYIAKEKATHKIDVKNQSSESDIKGTSQPENCSKRTKQNKSSPQDKEGLKTSNLCQQQDSESILDLSSNRNGNNNEYISTKDDIAGDSDFCSIMHQQSLPILPEYIPADKTKNTYSELFQSIAEKVSDENVDLPSKRLILNDDLKIGNDDVVEKVRKSVEKKLGIGKYNKETKKPKTDKKSKFVENMMHCENENRSFSSELVTKSKKKIHKLEKTKHSSSSQTIGHKTKICNKKSQVKNKAQKEKKKQIYQDCEDANVCIMEKIVPSNSHPKTSGSSRISSEFKSCASIGNSHNRDIPKHRNNRTQNISYDFVQNMEQKNVWKTTSTKTKLNEKEHRKDRNEVDNKGEKSTIGDTPIQLMVQGFVRDRQKEVLDKNTDIQGNHNYTKEGQERKEISNNGTFTNDEGLELNVNKEHAVRKYMIPCLGEMYVVTVNKDGTVKSEKKRKKENRNMREKSGELRTKVIDSVAESVMKKDQCYHQEMSGLDILSEVASCISKSNFEEEYKTDKKLFRRIGNKTLKDRKDETKTTNIKPRKVTNKKESTISEKEKLRKEKTRKEYKVNSSVRSNNGKDTVTDSSKSKTGLRKSLSDHNYAKYDENTSYLKKPLQLEEKDEMDQDLPKLTSRSRQKKQDISVSNKECSLFKINSKTKIELHRQNDSRLPFIEVNQNLPHVKPSVLIQLPKLSKTQSVSNSENIETDLSLPTLKVTTMAPTSAATKSIQSSEVPTGKYFRLPLKEMCPNLSEVCGTVSQRTSQQIKNVAQTSNFPLQQTQENELSAIAPTSNLILQQTERNQLSTTNVLPQQSAGNGSITSDCLSHSSSLKVPFLSSDANSMKTSKYLSQQLATIVSTKSQSRQTSENESEATTCPFQQLSGNMSRASTCTSQQLSGNMFRASTCISQQSSENMSRASTCTSQQSSRNMSIASTCTSQQLLENMSLASTCTSQQSSGNMSIASTVPTWTSEANCPFQQSLVNMGVDTEQDPYIYRDYPRDVVAYEDLSLFSNGSQLCKSSTVKVLPLVEPTVKNLNPLSNISVPGGNKKWESMTDVQKMCFSQDPKQTDYVKKLVSSDVKGLITKPYLPVNTTPKPLWTGRNLFTHLNTSVMESTLHNSRTLSTDLNKNVSEKYARIFVTTNESSSLLSFKPHLYTSIKPFMTSTDSLCTIPCVWEKDKLIKYGLKSLPTNKNKNVRGEKKLDCCGDIVNACSIQNEALDLRIQGSELNSTEQTDSSLTTVEATNVDNMKSMECEKSVKIDYKNEVDMFSHLSKNTKKRQKKQQNKRKRDLLGEFNRVCSTNGQDKNKMARMEEIKTSNSSESYKDEIGISNTETSSEKSHLIEKQHTINSGVNDINIVMATDKVVSHNPFNNESIIRQVTGHQNIIIDNQKKYALKTIDEINDENAGKDLSGYVEDITDNTKILESQPELESLPYRDIKNGDKFDPNFQSSDNSIIKPHGRLQNPEITSANNNVSDRDEETIIYCEESDTSIGAVDCCREDDKNPGTLKYGLQSFHFDTSGDSGLNQRQTYVDFDSSPLSIDSELNIGDISPFKDFDNIADTNFSSNLYTDFENILGDQDSDLSSKYFGEVYNVPLHSSPIFTKTWHDAPDSCSKFKVDNLLYHPIALPMGYYSDDESDDNIDHKDKNGEIDSLAQKILLKAHKSPHDKTQTFCQWVLYRLDNVKKPCHWQCLTQFEDEVLNEKKKAFDHSSKSSVLHKYLTTIKDLRSLKERKYKMENKAHTLQQMSYNTKNIQDPSDFNKDSQKTKAAILSENTKSDLVNVTYCSTLPEMKDMCHIQGQLATTVHNVDNMDPVHGAKHSVCTTSKIQENGAKFTNTETTLNQHTDDTNASVSVPTTRESTNSKTLLCEVTGMFLNIEKEKDSKTNSNESFTLDDFSTKCVNKLTNSNTEFHQSDIGKRCCEIKSIDDNLESDLTVTKSGPVLCNEVLMSKVSSDCTANKQDSTVSEATSDKSTKTTTKVFKTNFCSKENTGCSIIGTNSPIATTETIIGTTAKVHNMRRSSKDTSFLKEATKSVTEMGTPVLEAVNKFVKEAKILFSESKAVKDLRIPISSEETSSLEKGTPVSADKSTSLSRKPTQMLHKTVSVVADRTTPHQETPVTPQVPVKSVVAHKTTPHQGTPVTSQVAVKSVVAHRTTPHQGTSVTSQVPVKSLVAHRKTPHQGTPVTPQVAVKSVVADRKTPHQETSVTSQVPVKSVVAHRKTPHQGTPVTPQVAVKSVVADRKTPHQGTPVTSQVPVKSIVNDKTTPHQGTPTTSQVPVKSVVNDRTTPYQGTLATSQVQVKSVVVDRTPPLQETPVTSQVPVKSVVAARTTPHQGTPVTSQVPVKSLVADRMTPYQGTPVPSQVPVKSLVADRTTPHPGTPVTSQVPVKSVVADRSTSHQGTPVTSQVPVKSLVVDRTTPHQGTPVTSQVPVKSVVVDRTPPLQGTPVTSQVPVKSVVADRTTPHQGTPLALQVPVKSVVVDRTPSYQGTPATSQVPVKSVVVDRTPPHQETPVTSQVPVKSVVVDRTPPYQETPVTSQVPVKSAIVDKTTFHQGTPVTLQVPVIKTPDSKPSSQLIKTVEVSFLKCVDTSEMPVLVKPMATVTPLMKPLETSGMSVFIRSVETKKSSTKSTMTKETPNVIKPLAKVSPVKSPGIKENSLSTDCLTFETSSLAKCEEKRGITSFTSLAAKMSITSTGTPLLATDSPLAKYEETTNTPHSGECLTKETSVTETPRVQSNKSSIMDRNVPRSTRVLVIDGDNAMPVISETLENTGNCGGQNSTKMSVSPITEKTCEKMFMSGVTLSKGRPEMDKMPTLLLKNNTDLTSDTENNNQCVNAEICLTEFPIKQSSVKSQEMDVPAKDDKKEITKNNITYGDDTQDEKMLKVKSVDGCKKAYESGEKLPQIEAADSCNTIDKDDRTGEVMDKYESKDESETQMYKNGEYIMETRAKRKRNTLSGLNLLNKLSQEAQQYIGCSIDEKLNQVRPKKLPKHLQYDSENHKKELLISYRGKGYHRDSDNGQKSTIQSSINSQTESNELKKTNCNLRSIQTEYNVLQSSSLNGQTGELARQKRQAKIEKLPAEIEDKKCKINIDESKNECSDKEDSEQTKFREIKGKPKNRRSEQKPAKAKTNCKDSNENEDVRNNNIKSNGNKNTKDIIKKTKCNEGVKNRQSTMTSKHLNEKKKVPTCKENCKKDSEENTNAQELNIDGPNCVDGSFISKNEDVLQTVTTTFQHMKKKGKKRKNNDLNLESVKKNKDQLITRTEEIKRIDSMLDLDKSIAKESEFSITENKTTKILKLDSNENKGLCIVTSNDKVQIKDNTNVSTKKCKIQTPNKQQSTNDVKSSKESVVTMETKTNSDVTVKLKSDVSMEHKSSNDSGVTKGLSYESDNKQLAPSTDSVKPCDTWNITSMRSCKVLLKRTRVSPRRFKEFYMEKSFRLLREKEGMAFKARKVLPSKLKYRGRKMNVEKSESKMGKSSGKDKNKFRQKEGVTQNTVTKTTTGNVKFRVVTDRTEQVKIKRNKKLLCKFCKQWIPKCNLMTHTQTEHPWRCVTCTRVFDSRGARKLHFKEFHTGNELHTCMICRLNFHYLRTMEQHRKSHVHQQLARLQMDIIGLIRGCLGKYNIPSISHNVGNQAQGKLSGMSVLPLTEGDAPILDNKTGNVSMVPLAVDSSENRVLMNNAEQNNQMLITKEKADVLGSVDVNTKNPTDTFMVTLKRKMSNGEEVTIKNFLHYEPGLREVIQDLEFCLGSTQQSRLHGMMTDYMPGVPFGSVETIIDQINVFHNMTTGYGPQYLQGNMPAGTRMPYLQGNMTLPVPLTNSQCPPATLPIPVPFNQSESSRNDSNNMTCLQSEGKSITENKMSDDLSALNLSQIADFDMTSYDPSNETNLKTINTSDINFQQENLSGLGSLLLTTEQVLTNETDCSMKNSDKGPSSYEWLTRNLQDIEEDTLIPDFLLSPLKGLEDVDSYGKSEMLQNDQTEADICSTQKILLDISGNTKGDNPVQAYPYDTQDSSFSLHGSSNNSSDLNFQHTFNMDIINNVGNSNLEILQPSTSGKHGNTQKDDLQVTSLSAIQQEYEQISKDIEKDVLSYCDE